MMGLGGANGWAMGICASALELKKVSADIPAAIMWSFFMVIGMEKFDGLWIARIANATIQ
jgi:hypothetical protein